MVNKALVIFGPTSTGKTSLALKIAKEFNGEIVSVDSRQVYKFMDIGTGKIPVLGKYDIKKGNKKWEVDGIPIHMYDTCYPNDNYTVTNFVDDAKDAINNIVFLEKLPILVGGTGFYLDILLSRKNVFATPDNVQLRRELERLDIVKLQERLKSLNLTKYNEIDIKNPIRLIRAIEIEESRAKEVSIGLKDFEYLSIRLSSTREYLYERVDRWCDEIISNGLIDEVKELIDRGYKDTAPIKGIIYKSVIKFINDEIDNEELRNEIKNDLHHYVKRQQTYFKKMHRDFDFEIKDNTFDHVVLKQVELFCNAK